MLYFHTTHGMVEIDNDGQYRTAAGAVVTCNGKDLHVCTQHAAEAAIRNYRLRIDTLTDMVNETGNTDFYANKLEEYRQLLALTQKHYAD
jgi:hypothetical protein